MAEAKKKSMNKLVRNKDDVKQKDDSEDYSSYDEEEGPYFSRRSKSTEPNDDLHHDENVRRRPRQGRRSRSRRSRRRRTRSRRR